MQFLLALDVIAYATITHIHGGFMASLKKALPVIDDYGKRSVCKYTSGLINAIKINLYSH